VRNPFPRFIFIGLGLTVALALSGSPAWMAPPANKIAPPKNSSQLARMAAQGEVRVLVHLADPSPALQPGANRAQQASAVAQDFKHRSPRSFEAIPYLAMTVDAADLAAMQNDPRIAGVYEDRQNEIALTDTTALIGATQAWAGGHTGAGQSVAILDTGFDTAHPMLAGKTVAEACFSSPQHGSISLCPNGQSQQIGPGAAINCNTQLAGSAGSSCKHGTHVAGIAIGSSAVLSGVAPGASLVGVQVFSLVNNCSGGLPCLTAWDSDILKGLDQVYAWRAQFNIAAVNLSLGGGSFSSQPACDASGQPYKDMFARFNQAGIPVVVAAGNGSKTGALSMPGCVTGALSAGATTQSDAIAWFSNSADFLMLLAPGNSVYSAAPGGSYNTLSGTSMAAPHIAGAIAVLKQKMPDTTVMQLYEALETTGMPVADTRAGAGNRVKKRIALLDALNALDAPFSGDAFEPDDTPAQAQPITPTLAQTRRFAMPGDQDWLTLLAQANHIYRIETFGLTAQTDTVLALYDDASDAVPAATHDDVAQGIDRRSVLTFTALADGPIFVQVSDWDAAAFLNTQYDVLVTQVGVATPAPTSLPPATETPAPSPTATPTPTPARPKLNLYLPFIKREP
jgi:subtilisin family serine protease